MASKHPRWMKRMARQWLADLDQFYLEVGLTPAPDQRSGGSQMVRTVFNQNPKWYRDFCDQYQKQRWCLTARCESCGNRHDTRGGKFRLKRCGRQSRRHQRFSFKSDTSIVRRDVIKALRQMSEGEVRTEYARRLLAHMETVRANSQRATKAKEDWAWLAGRR